MLKKIINALKAYEEIKDYKVIEVNTSSTEAFYDLQKLETTRQTKTFEANVTVYLEKLVNEEKKLGQASFIVSHNISKKELDTLIKEAIYGASFINNQYYELVKVDKKRSYKQKVEEKTPLVLLQDIAKIFFTASNNECMFNALELFYVEKDAHIVNSCGVDYKKTTHNVLVEAIPSYKSEAFKTELYRMFTYDEVNYDKIKEDSENAIKDVLLRANAKQNTLNGKINVILKDDKIRDLFNEYISTYKYADVYHKSNYKNIGEMVQENAANLLTISLAPASKADFFDGDGVLLKKVSLIKKGKLMDYYGSNRFAYYLGMAPNGRPKNIVIEKGTTPVEKLMKEPYIEIIDLSGIQVDIFSDYIGGEVRLAKYFDGINLYALSGFSFTANLNDCVNKMIMSKETTKVEGYIGPKYALLKDVEIM